MALGCDEAPLFSNTSTTTLNNPVSMLVIPGTDLGVVANANVNLTDPEGSLVAVDLTTRELLEDTQVPLPNFAGRMAVNPTTQELFVTSRSHDELLVFSYSIPGSDGERVSFSPVTVGQGIAQNDHGILTDEDPFDVWLASDTARGDVVMVTNSQSGSVLVVDENAKTVFDLDPLDDVLEGRPLISAANFRLKELLPGAGANRFYARNATDRVLYITSSRTNNIYLFDTFDQQVEGMLDLSSITLATGTRGMAITSDGVAFVAHFGMDSVLVMDVSHIAEDGNDFEVVETRLLDIIYTGKGPDGLVLSPDESTVFVTNQGENSVSRIDVVSRTVLDEIDIFGAGPGELIVDEGGGRNVIYALNFLDHSISVLNLADGSFVEKIQ